MDIWVGFVLPLSLAVIMLSLGLGLTLGDFARVFTRGQAFLLGALCQIVLLPIVAFGIILTFGITGELAVGIMLLSFCPGGVTTNIVSKLARGDVALSVSLTAVVSLLSIVTVPLMIAWAVGHFMGANAPEVSVTEVAITMFLITALPVGIGMLIRGLAPGFARRIESGFVTLAGVLFVAILGAALAANWGVFITNLATLGPALIALNIIMMLLPLAVAGALGLTWQERKTISIEAGIQNGTLGIAVAPLIAGSAVAIPVMALPSAVYGITMYLVALPMVLWLRAK